MDEYHPHSRVKVDDCLIDEGMAELMRSVWGFGIRTKRCCQGGPETPFLWSWIQFWDIADGIRFLEGTGYLAGWTYADDIHLYLTPPILPQAGPSPMVVFKHSLLPSITKLWSDGTAKKPEGENKEES
jgi:hypothetical protein